MVTKADIQWVRSLADKRARSEHGVFVAEGEKLVGELLASDFDVVRVFATSGFPGAEPVSQREMERLSHLKTHTPVLAVARVPRHGLPDEPGRELTIALDGVQDPGNLGTIIRLADWFGIGDVVCSHDTADCFNPKVVQATMGAILRVRVHYADLRRVLEHAAAHMESVYGTFLDGENIYEADLGEVSSGVIVLGSEGRGISPEVAAAITRKLHIPPYPAGNPASESLNVATAAAIVCSEFRRRTHA